MSQFVSTLGDVVRTARQRKHMSQELLAERIDVCKRTITDIENNIGNPKFDILYKLVRELELPPEQIFYPDVRENFEQQKVLSYEVKDCSEQEMNIIISVVQNLKATLRDEAKR